MFYISGFHPKLIVLQIIALQCCFYLTLGTCILILDLLSGFSPKLMQLFSCSAENWEGWLSIISISLTSLFASFYMLKIVERTSKCLDFSSTVFALHLLCTYLCCGFPFYWSWWLTNLMNLIMMTVFAEYLCTRIELKAIPRQSATSFV